MKHQHSWNMAERFSEFPHTHPASSLAPRRAEQCQEALQDKKPQIEGKPHFFQQQKFTQSQGQDLRLAEGKNKRMAGKALLTTAGIRQTPTAGTSSEHYQSSTRQCSDNSETSSPSNYIKPGRRTGILMLFIFHSTALSVPPGVVLSGRRKAVFFCPLLLFSTFRFPHEPAGHLPAWSRCSSPRSGSFCSSPLHFPSACSIGSIKPSPPLLPQGCCLHDVKQLKHNMITGSTAQQRTNQQKNPTMHNAMDPLQLSISSSRR